MSILYSRATYCSTDLFTVLTYSIFSHSSHPFAAYPGTLDLPLPHPHPRLALTYLVTCCLVLTLHMWWWWWHLVLVLTSPSPTLSHTTTTVTDTLPSCQPSTCNNDNGALSSPSPHPHPPCHVVATMMMASRPHLRLVLTCLDHRSIHDDNNDSPSPILSCTTADALLSCWPSTWNDNDWWHLTLTSGLSSPTLSVPPYVMTMATHYCLKFPYAMTTTRAPRPHLTLTHLACTTNDTLPSCQPSTCIIRRLRMDGIKLWLASYTTHCAVVVSRIHIHLQVCLGTGIPQGIFHWPMQWPGPLVWVVGICLVWVQVWLMGPRVYPCSCLLAIPVKSFFYLDKWYYYVATVSTSPT